MKKIVIIGGGFAGLQLAKNLALSDTEITLIDRLNHHQFQPLFYQVATSRIEPSSISFPLRKIFQNSKNIQIRMADVFEIDPNNKCLKTGIGDIEYDTLVIATGCKTNFFGNKEIETNAWPLKTTFESINVRNKILLNFEDVFNQMERNPDSLFNIVIVGAGPTGVELAGAFAETKFNILPKDYPDYDFSKLKIILIEGGNSPLGNMSENARTKSAVYLKQLGVDLITGTFVTSYNGSLVKLSNGQELQSKSVIWAAGVTGNIIPGLSSEVVTKNNRIKVDRYNKVEGYSDIYAIGDIALMTTPNYPQGHPQVANVAINQAKNLAKNLKAISLGKPQKEYEYKDLGSMATIGKHKAVVDLPKIKFSGTLAWLIWMFLHLMLILSVKNKLIIFINWAWSYMTSDSSLRLILSNDRPGVKKNNSAF